jgi:hypothetical protein
MRLHFLLDLRLYVAIETEAHMTNIKQKETALNAFIAKKAEIDAMLARLTALSDDHFNSTPDEINWGHVGTLAHYASLLKQVTDSAFHEGEFAE